MFLIDFKNNEQVESIFRANYQLMVSFAMKYLDDKDLCQEVVQDIFYKLWTKGETLEIRISIKSYLLASVRNACLNVIKHKQVQSKYQQSQVTRLDFSQFEDSLEIEELQQKINLALNKIPEKCRRIFELNRYEGKKYKEIAKELNLSLKTVENQMGKALKIMRSELGDYLPLFLFLYLNHYI